MADFDDVLACQLDAEGAVNVKDTFNFRMGRNNLIDDPHIEDHNVSAKGRVCVCVCACGAMLRQTAFTPATEVLNAEDQ